MLSETEKALLLQLHWKKAAPAEVKREIHNSTSETQEMNDFHPESYSRDDLYYNTHRIEACHELSSALADGDDIYEYPIGLANEIILKHTVAVMSEVFKLNNFGAETFGITDGYDGAIEDGISNTTGTAAIGIDGQDKTHDIVLRTTNRYGSKEKVYATGRSLQKAGFTFEGDRAIPPKPADPSVP